MEISKFNRNKTNTTGILYYFESKLKNSYYFALMFFFI